MAEFRKLKKELAEMRAGMENVARKLRSAVEWSYDPTYGSSDADRARCQVMEEVARAIDEAFGVDSTRKVPA